MRAEQQDRSSLGRPLPLLLMGFAGAPGGGRSLATELLRCIMDSRELLSRGKGVYAPIMGLAGEVGDRGGEERAWRLVQAACVFSQAQVGTGSRVGSIILGYRQHHWQHQSGRQAAAFWSTGSSIGSIILGCIRLPALLQPAALAGSSSVRTSTTGSLACSH